MDDTEEDAGYSPSSYGMNDQDGYGSSQQPKLSVGNATYPGQVGSSYGEEEEEEEEDEGNETGEEDGGDGVNGDMMVGKDNYDEEDDEDGDEEEEDEDDGMGNQHAKEMDHLMEQHPKKRKLKNLIGSYEFAPRVPASSAAPASSIKPSIGGRNPATDWTEHETFVLLDAWGDRFLQLGRKSLRSEEWQEVADKVSQESKIERTDTQCRNRLDTLKKKYKKEKTRLAQAGGTSKWVYFRKMDALMSTPPQQGGLSCGMDSGEYVFMNPRVYLNRANGLDEMRDSPGISESSKGEGNDSDGLTPSKKTKRGKKKKGSTLGLLANSIQQFSEIYEKIENNKRQQMIELEKMRMDFQKELEMQRRQILEKAQAEIVRIWQGVDDKVNDVSAEDDSG